MPASATARHRIAKIPRITAKNTTRPYKSPRWRRSCAAETRANAAYLASIFCICVQRPDDFVERRILNHHVTYRGLTKCGVNHLSKWRHLGCDLDFRSM